jgi:hypothetical protein
VSDEEKLCPCCGKPKRQLPSKIRRFATSSATPLGKLLCHNLGGGSPVQTLARSVV